MTRLAHEALTPLEQFLRDYVEAREGVWDEIEPGVYDLLFGADMIEVAFDPEALPEHPRAQLATLGSPLFDRLLSDAAERWSSARLYRVGLNVRPHDLESRVRRAATFPPSAVAAVERVRTMNFPQAIFWFKAQFASDQKEEEMLRVGIDLHHGREVRQLDALLALDRLSEQPEAPLAEARHVSLAAGYRAARAHAARSVAPLANARRREWSGAVEKQIARMSVYYARLREEAADTAARGADPAAAAVRAASRREAIDREEQLRTAELRRKSELRVGLKLSSLMLVQQPKLLVSLSVSDKGKAAGRLELVWDPVSESVEAVPCPRCGQPTFAFRIDRGGLACERCASR